jgi:AraC-like DNA-binding protein
MSLVSDQPDRHNPLPLSSHSLSGTASIIASDFHQIWLVSSGRLRLRREETISEAPLLLIIPSGNGIKAEQIGPVRARGIRFSDDFLSRLQAASGIYRAADEFIRIYKLNTLQAITGVLPLSPDQCREAEGIFHRIAEEEKEHKALYDAALCSSFISLLVILVRIQNADQRTKKKESLTWNIEEIIAFLEQNYTQHFELKELAARCGLNPSYFSRSFKEKTGSSLFEYINRLRIRKSCLLLKKTNLSILEIAEQAGYNSISFFNRYFQRVMKMSPRQYRRQIMR